jgi:folate-binding protein YgfZ
MPEPTPPRRSFADGASEYRHAREGAALFDVSDRGRIEAIGAEAASFLHNLCTNEVRNLPAGGGCEAFLTTGQAKIVAHLFIDHVRYSDGRDSYWLDTDPGTGPAVATHLDRYLISERVELFDRSEEFVQFHVAGARAEQVLRDAFRSALPDLREGQNAVVLLDGVECQIRRHDPLGLPGYDVLCAGANAATVREAILHAGAVPAGPGVYETLRVEAGMPRYGVDMDETNMPPELSRTERTISYTKGCYIGQETIARIRTYGHTNRSLVGLRLSGEGTVPVGSKMLRDGQEVGKVTSSVVSPLVGAPIALAVIRRGSEAPTTELTVATQEDMRTALVVSLPFTAPGPATTRNPA